MDYLIPEYETLEAVHVVVLQVSGGKEGIHDKKLLMSALERPQTYIQYVEKYDINTIYTYRLNDIHFPANLSMNSIFDDLVMWVVLEKPAMKDLIRSFHILTRVKKIKNNGTDRKSLI